MITYSDLVVGRHFVDPAGVEWELAHRAAPGHSHTFVRPGGLMRGKQGVDWTWANENRLNTDGWKRP